MAENEMKLYIITGAIGTLYYDCAFFSRMEAKEDYIRKARKEDCFNENIRNEAISSFGVLTGVYEKV